ncbi:hypothetical protein BABINDRAFT_162481 [Babjeviella inositovora NRRL Y-12698]|uniref:VWFA domain-containing protein n=1 Tax=Babjeviella inositovora NRRL Y-12698 TaxID=984486 RepID=A0A1E3QMC4_9ASCO|nr:uncharacterized protein BABINDRAFT_162481 [Babjeviella inositovora NRRL Y-12698]ODQ78800.1 hypothetical protein BABINDRAFT_162481 [Babjeviella inositovora NRRL Y-12698]
MSNFPPPAYFSEAQGSAQGSSSSGYQRPAAPPPGHRESSLPISAEQEKGALNEKYQQQSSQQSAQPPLQQNLLPQHQQNAKQPFQRNAQQPHHVQPQYSDHDYENLLPSIIQSLNRLQNPELWKDYVKFTRKMSSFRKMLGSKATYTDQDFAQISTMLIPSRKSHSFYTSREQVLQVLRENNAVGKLQEIKQTLQIPSSFPMEEVAELLFFDVVLYVDNSGSMADIKRQTEFKTLMLDLMKTVSIKDDGFSLRFMNKNDQIQQGVYQDLGLSFDNIRSEQTLKDILNSPHVGYFGVTPLASQLHQNVIKPMVLSKIPARGLAKPVMVVVLTDGMPYGELPPFSDRDGIAQMVKQTRRELLKYGYPAGAVLYQFAQVGDDKPAADYLNGLDDDRDIGDLIDVTNVYAKEKLQMNNDVADRMFYLKKLVLGPIDEQFDKADER